MKRFFIMQPEQSRLLGVCQVPHVQNSQNRRESCLCGLTVLLDDFEVCSHSVPVQYKAEGMPAGKGTVCCLVKPSLIKLAR